MRAALDDVADGTDSRGVGGVGPLRAPLCFGKSPLDLPRLPRLLEAA